MDLSEMRLDFRSAQKWDVFRQPPARDQALRSMGKAAFLAQVDEIPQPLSVKTRASKPDYLDAISIWFHRSRLSPAFAPIMIMLVSLVFVLTTGVALAYSAQDSLPGEPLYGIKTASENLRYTLATNKERRLLLDLEFTDRRVGELAALNKSGQAIPATIEDRMQLNLHRILVLARNMDDQTMRQALLQIQQRTELQQNVISHLPNQTDPFITRIRAMLQLQMDYIKQGLEDPLYFRLRLPTLEIVSPTETMKGIFNKPTIETTPGPPQPAVMPTAKSRQATAGPNNLPIGQSTPAVKGPSGSGKGETGQPGGPERDIGGPKNGPHGPGGGDGGHQPNEGAMGK